jgi:hypothetical protein
MKKSAKHPMQKRIPKLTLHRETLRALDQPQLEGVNGGVSASACVPTCLNCTARCTSGCHV